MAACFRTIIRIFIGQKLLNKKINIKTHPSWNFSPERKNCKNVITIVKNIKSLENQKTNYNKKEKMRSKVFIFKYK